MSKLNVILSLGTKGVLAIVAIAILHALSGVLGSLGILSDALLFLGAVSAYNLLTNSESREEWSSALSDVIDLDDLVYSLGLFLSFFTEGQDEDDGYNVQSFVDFLDEEDEEEVGTVIQ